MAWPNDPCPANRPNYPSQQTAAVHLAWIMAKATVKLAADPVLLNRILLAIAACQAQHCVDYSTSQQGSPPANLDQHCQFVLWARCHADEGNWGLCADELEHGT